MQTLNVFYRIQCILNLHYLLDLAGLIRVFLSSMYLDKVLAGVAVFTDFHEVHTDSFAPTSCQQYNTSLLLLLVGCFTWS